MAKVNATEFTDKWQRRMKAATQDIQNGVSKVTEAPGKKAAAAQEKMLLNLMESINNGTWAKKVAGVSLDEWKQSTLNKGLQRLSAGVDGAGPKVAAMAEKLLKDIDAVQAEVRAMPNNTLEDSIARMTAWARGMNKRKQK